MLNKITFALILVACWVTAESGAETGEVFGALVFGTADQAAAASAPSVGR